MTTLCVTFPVAPAIAPEPCGVPAATLTAVNAVLAALTTTGAASLAATTTSGRSLPLICSIAASSSRPEWTGRAWGSDSMRSFAASSVTGEGLS